MLTCAVYSECEWGASTTHFLYNHLSFSGSFVDFYLPHRKPYDYNCTGEEGMSHGIRTRVKDFAGKHIVTPYSGMYVPTLVGSSRAQPPLRSFTTTQINLTSNFTGTSHIKGRNLLNIVRNNHH